MADAVSAKAPKAAAKKSNRLTLVFKGRFEALYQKLEDGRGDYDIDTFALRTIEHGLNPGSPNA